MPEPISINDVIVNGEPTIAPDTDGGGVGTAYTTGDPASTTINDTDYVPMSDANGNRKKSLWSTIINKLKDIFNPPVVDIVNVYGAKNLIPFPYHRQSGYTTNGATFTYDDEGVITVNKVAGNEIAYFALFSNVLYPNAEKFLVPNTNYILSMELEDASDTSCYLKTQSSSDLAAIRNKATGKYEVSFTTPETIYSIMVGLYYAASATETNAKVKLMIRMASIEDNTYVPYAKTNKQLTKDTSGATFYGTCDTAAGTVTKVVTLSNADGFSLRPGVVIGVKYTYTNSATFGRLNVNDTGAIGVAYQDEYPLYHRPLYVFGYAGYITYYMYDGQYWVFLNHSGNNVGTTYTFVEGDSNGQIKVTPSGEISHNVSVKGLKSAAYIDADKSGTANTIVQRTGYGYINAGNSATENPASYTAYAVFQDSDGYYRKATKDVFKSWLGITTGTWTPQIYDNNTFKRNLATSNYYKVGNIIMAYYAGYNPDLSGISTMLQIRNFPGKVYGGQMYIAADAAGGAQLTVQGSGNNAVYFRPNWVSSRISNPSSPGNVTALIWGIE